MSSTPEKLQGSLLSKSHKTEDVQPPQSPDEEAPMDITDKEAQAQGLGYEFEVKEQDRWLPIANVARIMKMALPDNAKIAKEAKECMQECVSEFISFITSEASEKCQQEKRKTVNGEDILFAMTSLGFENYSEALKIYLSRYRETLLANQKPAGGALGGPGGGTGQPASYGAAPGTAGSGGGNNGVGGGPSNGAAGPANPGDLSGEADMGDDGNTSFGYAVHNGSGNGDY